MATYEINNIWHDSLTYTETKNTAYIVTDSTRSTRFANKVDYMKERGDVTDSRSFAQPDGSTLFVIFFVSSEAKAKAFTRNRILKWGYGAGGEAKYATGEFKHKA